MTNSISDRNGGVNDIQLIVVISVSVTYERGLRRDANTDTRARCKREYLLVRNFKRHNQRFAVCSVEFKT